MRFSLPLLLLLACDSSATLPDDSGDSDTDTDTDSDTDTDDTGDTADTGDVETPPDLAWNLTGDTDGLTFALVSIAVFDDFAMADIYAEAPAQARVELAAGTPDPSFLTEFPDLPGLYLGYFMAGVHEDDGDDVWDPDEDWVGAASSISVYLDGVVPPEFIDLGLHVGWNAMVPSEDNEVVDPLQQALDIAFAEQLEVGGGWDESVPDSDRVTSVAAAIFSGVVTDAMDEAALGAGEWALVMDGAPPSDHFIDMDGNGTTEGVELYAAYADANHDHVFDPNSEAATGLACHQGRVVIGYWLAPSTDLTAILFLNGTGASLGWNAVAFDPDTEAAEFLSPEQAMDLELSANCQL